MPVILSKKILFIHIPKTGGTSIEKSLGIHVNGRNVKPDSPLFGRAKLVIDNQTSWASLQHLTFDQATAYLNKYYKIKLDENWFRFTFVRNPFDRLVSLYAWQTAKQMSQFPTDFNEFIDYVANDFEDNTHHRPQCSFFSEHQEFDFVGRFENYAADTKRIYEMMEIEPLKTNKGEPHFAKRTKREAEYRTYYNEQTRKKVENLYAEDLERFGYEF